MKTDKFFDATYQLIIGLGLIVLSLITLIGRKWLYINLVSVFLMAVFFLSVKDIINYFRGNKKNKNISFSRSIISILFCVVFSLFKDIPLSILPILFGTFLVMNSIIHMINFAILLENNDNGKLTELFLTLVYLIGGFSSILAPLKYLEAILIIIGIYFMLLGVNYIKDFISTLLPKHIKDKVRRSIRISLPTVFAAIIPYAVLREINYLLDKKNMDEEFIYEEKNNDLKPDIEVLVHTSNYGFNRLGHCDIIYDDKVISYGAYDKKTRKFHDLIADGVVFTAPKDKYIPFCIKYSKKTLFCFGLKLTDKQKENVLKEMNLLFKELEPWDCPYKYDKDHDIKKRKKYDDYASDLYKATKADMYKFNKGKYKKYFLLGNNCVKLVDEILGKSGIDLLKMNGIITPGTYYEYLNREFKKKNSMVISRNIYNSDRIGKKKLKKIMKGL